MEKKLENTLESILFALGREITISELSETLKEDKSSIEKALSKIKIKYSNMEQDAPILFSNVNDTYSLVTNNMYYDEINLFIENTKRKNLSNAALEVLTIVAYNPKITKSEIEKVRGVNSDFAVSRLLECGLVYEVARLNLPGRPAAYSVTNEFLRNCDISSIEDLPDFNTIKVTDEQVILSDLEDEVKE